MPARLIQTRFDGGELSTAARGRLESDLYKRALSRCANFVPTQQGSAVTRGMMRRLLANPAGERSRMIEFHSADGQSYTLVLGDLTMRIVDSNGLLTAGGGAELVVNGTFDDQTGWILDSGATIQSGYLRLSPYSEYVPPLTWNWGVAFQAVVVATANYTFKYRIKAADAAHGVQVVVSVGGVTYYNQTHYVAGYHSVALALVAGAGSVSFSLISALHTGGASVDDVSLALTGGTDINLVTPWTLDQLDKVQWTSEQSSVDRLVLVHPNVAPQELKRTAAGAFTLGAVVFTAKPADWAGTNWPGVCEIFQGRLYLAATPDKRNSLWASKPGSLYDFTVGTGAPGDAIDEKIATKGAIRWAQGHKSLLLGTDVGVYVVTGSQGLVLPGDFQATRQGGYGSAPLHAVFAAGQAMYVSKDFRKVRATSFDLQSDAWESADVTLVADHLTRVGIRELHFATEPYEMLVALLADGTLACCTYSKLAQVAAWWRFSTDGLIKSVALSSGPDGAILRASVKRRVETSIEELVFDPNHDYVLDAALRLPAPAGTALAGLGHLEGETVRVIADGALQADKVVAGGQINLDTAAVTEVVVGLALPELRVTTLPKDVRDERTRDARLGVILNDSALPLLQGHRPADRTPSTPQDTPEARRSGKFRVAGKLGWTDEGAVDIVQDLPFRTEVLAIYEAAD